MDTTTSTGAFDSPEWLLGQVLAAYTSKNWTMLSALVLMAVVFIVRKLMAAKIIPDNAIPWVVQLCALVASIALGIYMQQDLYAIIMTAATVGLSAVGLWETLGKFLRNLYYKIFNKPIPDSLPPLPPLPPSPPSPPQP